MDKTLDYQGRWRSKTVAFRVSKEERKLLNREVIVQGNPRVYKALRNQMAEIYEKLMRLEQCGEVSDVLLYTLQVVAEIFSDSSIGVDVEQPIPYKHNEIITIQSKRKVLGWLAFDSHLPHNGYR